MKANIIVTAVLATALNGSLAAQEAIALRCGTLLDVENQSVIGNTNIVVRGEAIESVGGDIPSGATVIDLTDHTCSPGFMDMHVHLVHDGGVTSNPFTFSRSGSWRALRSLAAAQAMLDRGFTTIRTLGFDRHFETIDLRNAINSGEHVGPRIFVAPHGIQGRGNPNLLGTNTGDPEARGLNQNLFIVQGTGPVEMRQITAREITYGADWIKLSDAFGVGVTEQDLRAVVEEAHRLGKKVTQHVTMDPEHKAARKAIAAGVDSIEHAFITDGEVLQSMVDNDVYYVPTIWIIDYIARQEPGFKLSDGMFLEEHLAGAMAPMIGMLKQNTAMAHEMGVKIALGSDTIFDPSVIADAVEEFALLADATGDVWMALRAGNIVSAEMLGQDSQIGSIAPGKLADIVAMPDNPVQDITATVRVSFVMKGGAIVKE